MFPPELSAQLSVKRGKNLILCFLLKDCNIFWFKCRASSSLCNAFKYDDSTKGSRKYMIFYCVFIIIIIIILRLLNGPTGEQWGRWGSIWSGAARQESPRQPTTDANQQYNIFQRTNMKYILLHPSIIRPRCPRFPLRPNHGDKLLRNGGEPRIWLRKQVRQSKNAKKVIDNALSTKKAYDALAAATAAILFPFWLCKTVFLKTNANNPSQHCPAGELAVGSYHPDQQGFSSDGFMNVAASDGGEVAMCGTRTPAGVVSV